MKRRVVRKDEQWKPRRIDWARTAELRSLMVALIVKHHLESEFYGWRFYAVQTDAGGSYYTHEHIITIPTWVWKRSASFFQWYLHHELAHHAGLVHDAEFMRELKRICPPEALKHELNYKPKAARAAGIRRRNSVCL